MTRLLASLVLLLAACGEEEKKNPPPIGGTAGGASVSAGGQGETGPGDDDDAGGTMHLSGGQQPVPDLGMDLLLAGQILSGDPTITTPLNCALRLFEPGGIDPATGNVIQIGLQIPVTVQQFPTAYQVSIDDAAGVIGPGQAVYAAVTCDVDGDGLFDNVGGFYPALPLELFQLPATGIDVELFFQ